MYIYLHFCARACVCMCVCVVCVRQVKGSRRALRRREREREKKASKDSDHPGETCDSPWRFNWLEDCFILFSFQILFLISSSSFLNLEIYFYNPLIISLIAKRMSFLPHFRQRNITRLKIFRFRNSTRTRVIRITNKLTKYF